MIEGMDKKKDLRKSIWFYINVWISDCEYFFKNGNEQYSVQTARYKLDRIREKNVGITNGFRCQQMIIGRKNNLKDYEEFLRWC